MIDNEDPRAAWPEEWKVGFNYDKSHKYPYTIHLTIEIDEIPVMDVGFDDKLTFLYPVKRETKDRITAAYTRWNILCDQQIKKQVEEFQAECDERDLQAVGKINALVGGYYE